MIAALVVLNAFFVASEFAIVKVRSSQLDELADEGNLRAIFAKHVRAHLDAYLSATQLESRSPASRSAGSANNFSWPCSSRRLPW